MQEVMGDSSKFRREFGEEWAGWNAFKKIHDERRVGDITMGTHKEAQGLPAIHAVGWSLHEEP
jgi:hypothetical protein